MKTVFLMMALTLIAGCTKTVEEMSYTERQNLAAELVKRCMDQGVDVNSPKMKECTYDEAQKEVYSRRRRAAVEDARRSAPRRSTMCQNFGGNFVCF